MAIARHHLTIQEKNQLRAHHRERPELTQEQLREWVHDNFGKWIGRSTIGKIASMPEELCANPTAKRIQSGRYPEMEAELYEYIMIKQSEELLRDDQPILSEGRLWTKANEILTRIRGPSQSVSLGWVQRFKKRHGLHRSQRTVKMHTEVENTVAITSDLVETVVTAKNIALLEQDREKQSSSKRTRDESDGIEVEDELSLIPAPKKVASTSPKLAGRKQFVSADDILLLSQVLETKPWAYPQIMDGWQEVCHQLRQHSNFNLDKTAGACQARVVLLLDHLRAGNSIALRKSGTSQEYERKRELLAEVQAKISAFEEFQEDLRKRRGEPTPPSNVTQHDAAVAKVGEVAAAIAVAEATGEADRDGQRRLELLEIKMERELAEQRRYADEQVRQLERLQRAQLEAQQNQHAQLLATIQQQQAMMLDLIKSVAAHSKKD
ncbi:Tc5 transposase DNA-binding domain [Phytophthora infestans]|uniref:Tc5 transposase DNA-binding domain n=1 Tax=Phytophthora infestans TaxID=4787 RepID=A0A8S9UUU4_PHYIN|nr:Tc5 transposase DNA-binding domain [Phytophthora infestans]